MNGSSSECYMTFTKRCNLFAFDFSRGLDLIGRLAGHPASLILI